MIEKVCKLEKTNCPTTEMSLNPIPSPSSNVKPLPRKRVFLVVVAERLKEAPVPAYRNCLREPKLVVNDGICS
jgi:hypothetical protein